MIRNKEIGIVKVISKAKEKPIEKERKKINHSGKWILILEVCICLIN